MSKRRGPHQRIWRATFSGCVRRLSQQVRLVQAVLDGFLLDYRDWQLWEFVGRATRALPDMSRLSAWRAELAKTYPRITSFHAEVSAEFYRDVGFGWTVTRCSRRTDTALSSTGMVREALGLGFRAAGVGNRRNLPRRGGRAVPRLGVTREVNTSRRISGHRSAGR